MGCYGSKQQAKITFQDLIDHQQNTIRIQKIPKQVSSKDVLTEPLINPEDRQIKLILTPVQTVITQRTPKDVLKEIVKLDDQCIERYNEHELDIAYEMLIQIEKDLKQLQQRGFKVQMNQHFKNQFIQLSRILTEEYNDMIDFNNEILRVGWILQKDQKNFKIFSRIEGDTVGIKFQTILEVPFENFIAVMIQPDHYHAFLPFIVKSQELKVVRRNCKLGTIQMGFPIISNREAYFQGVLYNRLNNKKPSDRQFFMYTRSIHNRKDLQKLFEYDVKLNPKCVEFDYKYLVIKYVPISKNSGRIIMGMNMDLKLNMLPLSILQMVSINFSQDFYDSIVKISKKFEGSVWDKGIQKNSELFEFTKNAKNDFLSKTQK